MELHSHVAHVRAQLEAAASLGDERARQIASALGEAAEPAVRLALVAALSAAADEVTAALLDLPGAPTVTARLGPETGGEVHFDVRVADEPAASTPPPEDGDTSARISLRLGEALKSDIDAAARADGVSVNTWLVRAAALALTGSRGPTRGPFQHPQGRDAHHITGWING